MANARLKLNSDVTVIIPCYNDGDFIRKALDSVLSQTLQPDKIIIIDDGSDLPTKKVLDKISHKLVEIVYQKNQGVSVARNNGIKHSKTSYILTLDADDYFERTFLEKAYRFIEQNRDIAVVGCYYKLFGQTTKSNKTIEPKGGGVENFLVMNNGLGCSLFRKKCWSEVSGYDEEFKNGYEDWDFWISILSKGWKMHIIPEPLFNYRKKKVSRDDIALSTYDKELRIKLFEKHYHLYLTLFESYVYQSIQSNNTLRIQLNKREKSLDFKLGRLFLSPLRKIKSLIRSL